MHRFFLPPVQCRGDRLVLEGREAHHGLHVVRLRAGEAVEVLDGQGVCLTCQVSVLSRHAVELQVTARQELPRPSPRLTLVQAVAKPKAMDLIVQKAAELGVHRLVPILAERAVMQSDPERGKREKWEWIAIDSLKQCGSAWLPVIDPPQKLHEYLKHPEPVELSLVASLACQTHPRCHFEAFERAHRRGPVSACVWVGPEGDFTPRELEAIEAAGAHPISLGPRVLRSDTAAIYCLAIVRYALD